MSSDQNANIDDPAEPRVNRPQIDNTLTADGLLFPSHRDRCLYLGKSRKERLRWLQENAGSYWRVDDLQTEPDRLTRPAQSQSDTLAPVQPTSERASFDIRRGAGDADLAAPPRPADNVAAPCGPPLPLTSVKSITSPQPQPYTKPPLTDVERPKVVASSIEATAPNQAHGDACGREKQKGPAQRRKTRSKTAQRLLAERMLIVIEALTERPIYSYAADKAGIHRKTLEYWLKRSKAGDVDYELEWQGFALPFHEHCAMARDIADEMLRDLVLQKAKGVKVRIEDGRLIEELVGPPNGKMIRFFFTLARPDWVNNPDTDPPRTGGVLVVGDAAEQPPARPTASIRARQWKSGFKKVRDAGA